MKTPLYNINLRTLGCATFLSVTSQRGTLRTTSEEIVLPPIIEFDEKGNIRVLGPRTLLEGIQQHNYKSQSADFNAERLADLEVSQLIAQLEHFPVLPTLLETQLPHPIAEFIYSKMVYLKPSKELQGDLDGMGFTQKSVKLSQILGQVQRNLKEQKGVLVDLHAVPKKKVGTFCYVADLEGYSLPAKMFAFGYHKAIPNDRLARELSSLKAAEKFLNPVPKPFPLPENLEPFVTMLRVAVVGTREPMLDSVDLYPSATPKIACHLSRVRIEKNVSCVPLEKRNLEYRSFRSGIEVVHKELVGIDETQVQPGTIRLVLPGGVKVAAQIQEDQQAYCDGEPVDALIDLRTFAAKGAIATLAMLSGDYSREHTLEEAKMIFSNLERKTVTVNGTEFEGFVGDVPVMRPGQRYTELSKPSNDISTDIIARAILKDPYVVSRKDEKEYDALRILHNAIQQEARTLA